MTMTDLTKQDIRFYDDSLGTDAAARVKIREPRREMHWPKLALGDTYPVTDRDGRILRHEKVKTETGNNEDLI